MRIMTVPEIAIVPVPVKRNGQVFVEDRQVSFVDFLKTACQNYEPFCHAKNLPIYMKLLQVLAEGTEHDEEKEIIRFEDTDFDHLLEAVKNSKWLSPDVNLAYRAYYGAVYEAKRADTAKK